MSTDVGEYGRADLQHKVCAAMKLIRHHPQLAGGPPNYIMMVVGLQKAVKYSSRLVYCCYRGTILVVIRNQI